MRPSRWRCWWLRSDWCCERSRTMFSRAPDGLCFLTSLERFCISCITHFPPEDHQTANYGHNCAQPSAKMAKEVRVIRGHSQSPILELFPSPSLPSSYPPPNPSWTPAPGDDDQRMNTQSSRIKRLSSLQTDENNGDRFKRLSNH